MSPYLEACCLRISASVSYQRAAEDIEYLTGVEVSKSVQQRLVHRQNFDLPQVESTLEELSVDGGNIRIRTIKGQVCDFISGNRWKTYISEDCTIAKFMNLQLWVIKIKKEVWY